MRISDWSSDVCSSDLDQRRVLLARGRLVWLDAADGKSLHQHERVAYERGRDHFSDWTDLGTDHVADVSARCLTSARSGFFMSRSEEHTSELQSLMRISYAVFCVKKKKKKHAQINQTTKETRT